METDVAVHAVNLVREYPRRDGTRILAVDRLTMSIAYGEIFALIGPNGAGKTTFVKMCSTLVTPTSGRLLVNGFDVNQEDDEVRRTIGVQLANRRALYWKLTAMENIEFFSALHGMSAREGRKRAPGLLALMGLERQAHERVENFSGGMMQRLMICVALLHSLKLLLLDEPTAGLDPVVASDLRYRIKQFAKDGSAVVVATHNMSEAEELADTVAMINHGKMVAHGPPSRVTAFYGPTIAEAKLSGDTSGLDTVLGIFPHLSLQMHGGNAVTARFGAEQDLEGVATLVRTRLANTGSSATLEGLNLRKPNLDDVFVHYVTAKEAQK